MRKRPVNTVTNSESTELTKEFSLDGLTLEDVLSKVNKPKKVKGKRNEYMALCAAHHDRKPSLSITEKNGTVLLHCFAGCSFERVCQSLGIQTKPPYSAAEITGAKHEEIESVYSYKDETGALLYQVVRKPGKNFLLRRPLPNGKWEYSLGDVRRVLYQLPQLSDTTSCSNDGQRFVYICEGEKDVDNLLRLGLIATCNPHGAGKWRDDYNSSLAGVHCVVLPDNDEPGRIHTEKIARSLQGTAASVRVLSLPSLPAKGDVSDWLDQGGTAEQLIELAKNQPKYGSVRANIFSATDLLATHYPELKWAVSGILPEGLVLFVGSPKLGKSWAALGMGLAVSSGGQALGTVSVESGDVLYLALEDGRRRLQRRLKQLQRNISIPARLQLATEWPRLDAGGIDAIDEWLHEHPDARLVVIDTLKRVRPKEQSSGRLYDFDYDALASLGDLALRYGICILVIHHTRKADSDDVIDLASGTHGLTGAADAVLVLKRARGQADATLHATGRDFEDKEIALRWDNEISGFLILGDAAEYSRSEQRQDVITLLSTVGPLTPKQVAQALERENSATKKLLWTMSKEGELKVYKGRYSVISGNPGNPVTGQVEPTIENNSHQHGSSLLHKQAK
jgi:hypothetical protein